MQKERISTTKKKNPVPPRYFHDTSDVLFACIRLVVQQRWERQELLLWRYAEFCGHQQLFSKITIVLDKHASYLDDVHFVFQ